MPDSRVEKEAYTLVSLGYNVIILAWDRRDDYKEKKDEIIVVGRTIPIFRLGYKATYGEGFRNIVPYLNFQISMCGWLIKNRRKYDAIHACDFDTAFFSYVINKFLKKKFVFDIFDFICGDPKNLFQKIVKGLQLHIINHATGTIICTEERLNQIKGSRPRELAVIHNSPFIELSAKKKVKRQSASMKKSVVYVGILQEHRLLKEISQFFVNNSDIELHIGGFGKFEEYFNDLAKECDNILYYGKLKYDETISLETDCDIILAIYDPAIENHLFAAPNKFYEGLMLGKPLIMVRGTGMSDVVAKNDIGELIDYSQADFEKGLYKLIDRYDEWSGIKIRSETLYHRDYAWSIMKKRLYKFYKKIFIN